MVDVYLKRGNDIQKGKVSKNDTFLFYIEINPNAFATELIKMMIAKIGQRY